MKRDASSSCSTFIAACTIATCGCSLMAPKTKLWAPQTLTTQHLVELSPGTEVRLSLRDGRVVKGLLLSTGYLPESVYAARYASWRDSSSDAGGFPALGDTVSIGRVNRTPLRGSFRGFGSGELFVTPAGSAGIAHAALHEVEGMSGSGRTEVGGSLLVSLEKRGSLPRSAAAWVAVGRDTVLVPIDDVMLAQSLGPANVGSKIGQVMTGLLLSGLLGAGLLLLLFSNREAQGGSPPTQRRATARRGGERFWEPAVITMAPQTS